MKDHTNKQETLESIDKFYEKNPHLNIRKDNYEQHSHIHCFNNPANPCGLKGEHCCLCDIITNNK